MQENWVRDLKNSDPNIRRRAIVAMAESRDADALKILKTIYEKDSNPHIRELARKAGTHLWKSLNTEPGSSGGNGQKPAAPVPTPPRPQASHSTPNIPVSGTNTAAEKPVDSLQSLRDDFIEKTSPYPKPKPVPSVPVEQADLDPGHIPSVAVNSKKIATADTHLNRATAMLVKGDKIEAIRSLQQACRINPKLMNDSIAQNLAGELTGKTGQQAIQAIMAVKSGTGRQTKAKSQSGVTLYLLLGSIVVLAVAVFLFFQSGLGKKYSTFMLLSSLEKYQQNIGGYEVYIIPPKGNPPEEGWPVVVGLHGYGCLPEQMLVYTKKFTNKGILYITPSFGGYDSNSGNGPVLPMLNILKEAANQYSINQNNVVLLGLSRGGEFAYVFSTMHPEWVKGVVTSGATALSSDRVPASLTMPYSFSWSSKDGLKDLVIPIQVNPLIQQGYNVTVEVIEGSDFEITSYDLDQTLLFSQQ